MAGSLCKVINVSIVCSAFLLNACSTMEVKPTRVQNTVSSPVSRMEMDFTPKVSSQGVTFTGIAKSDDVTSARNMALQDYYDQLSRYTGVTFTSNIKDTHVARDLSESFVIESEVTAESENFTDLLSVTKDTATPTGDGYFNAVFQATVSNQNIQKMKSYAQRQRDESVASRYRLVDGYGEYPIKEGGNHSPAKQMALQMALLDAYSKYNQQTVGLVESDTSISDGSLEAHTTRVSSKAQVPDHRVTEQKVWVEGSIAIASVTIKVDTETTMGR